MSTITLGAATGAGSVCCARIRLDDDGLLVERESRTVARPDRLVGRSALRVDTGFDLLEADVAPDERAQAAGLAYRRRRDLLALRMRRRGPVRAVTVVRRSVSVHRALAETGEIARHPRVLIVDLGEREADATVVDTDSGDVLAHSRGGNSPDGVADAAGAALAGTDRSVPAAVLVGDGAGAPDLRARVELALHREGVDLVPVSDPDAVAAVGAALVAADRMAGAPVASGHSLRLGGLAYRGATMLLPLAVLVLLALSGVATAVAIGWSGDERNVVDGAVDFTPAASVATSEVTDVAPTSTSQPHRLPTRESTVLPPVTTVPPLPPATHPPTVQYPPTWISTTPSMTTFAPEPTITGTSPAPSTPSGSTGPTSGAGTSPGGTSPGTLPSESAPSESLRPGSTTEPTPPGSPSSSSSPRPAPPGGEAQAGNAGSGGYGLLPRPLPTTVTAQPR